MADSDDNNVKSVSARKQELLRKFCRQRRVETSCAAASSPTKSVKFNPEILQTSYGGTLTAHHMNDSNASSVNTTVTCQGGSDVDITVKVKGDSLSPAKVSITHEAPRRRSEPKRSLGSSSTKQTPKRDSVLNRLSGNLPQTPDCFNPVALEGATPVRGKRRHHTCEEEDCSGVTVAVRVRPFSARELADTDVSCVVSMLDNETTVRTEKGEEHRFAYDYSFWSFDHTGGTFASQEFVYESLAQPILANAFEGYNTCLFSYGQTGSGKSYSIMGHGEEVGIIPRFSEELFQRIDLCAEQNVTWNVEISYFEIYNEKIHDLLGPSVAPAQSKDVAKEGITKKPNLKVREHPVLGPYVEGLSTYVVRNFDDVEGWLSVGNKRRATASTGMNDKSSRSHSVFIMVLTQTTTDVIDEEKHEHSRISKVNLVDLAGSERQSTAKTSGDRLREGASINKSLLTLGKVISLLSERSVSTQKRKKLFIPYRDSVLTWLLRESLGGNSKTAMLATISPANVHMEETLSTLRYAKQARSIINSARVNEDPKARLIRELQAEIERLRSQGGGGGDDLVSASLTEIASLKEKLALKEKEMADLAKSWQEKLKCSEERKLEESRLLKKSGIALKMDRSLPSLVNLNEDPQLSELLLYMLNEGEIHVGQMSEEDGEEGHYIQLQGPLIADRHCIITHKSGRIDIKPVSDAPVYINGELINEKKQLHHGDRVILGGNHYFRFNHPAELKNRKSMATNCSQPKDFEFARQELINVQNPRLEAELEEARKKHEAELARQEKEAQMKLEEELARTQRSANAKMDKQRSEYERKLAALEHKMSEHRKKKVEFDKHCQEAEEVIKNLEKEKLQLEGEVEAGRKRRQLEAEAAQKSMQVSRSFRSQIIERLEREKKKITEEVEALKQKRGNTPITPRVIGQPGSSVMKKTPGSHMNLYRTVMAVREANKISHHLKKDTVFSQSQTEDGRPLIKVNNARLGVSTFWTMEKFEERLLQMREMFQSAGADDMEDSELDETFYDPSDAWEKDDRLEAEPAALSPQILRQLRSETPLERRSRFFESRTSPESISTPRHRLLSSVSTASSECGSQSSSVMIPLCRDYLTSIMDSFKGTADDQESMVDSILSCCEVLKTSANNLKDAFEAYQQDKPTGPFSCHVAAQTPSLVLTIHTQVLFSNIAVWFSQLGADDRLTSLGERLSSKAKTLGSKVMLLLQGVENDLDTMVRDSVDQMMTALCQVSRLCGQLTVASDAAVSKITSEPPTCSDDSRNAISLELQQEFVSGCERFLAQTLHESLSRMQDCHVRSLDLTDHLPSSALASLRDVASQVELAVASATVLLEKLQEMQVEVDSTSCLDTTIAIAEERRSTGNHSTLQRNCGADFERCRRLSSHVSSLTENTSHLVKVITTLCQASHPSSFEALVSPADGIQQSITSISQALSCAHNSSLTSDLSRSSLSALEEHFPLVEMAAQDAGESLQKLIELSQKHSPLNSKYQQFPMKLNGTGTKYKTTKVVHFS